MVRRIVLVVVAIALLGAHPAQATSERGDPAAAVVRARQLVDLVGTREALRAAAIAGFDRRMALPRGERKGTRAVELERFRPYFVAELERSIDAMLEAVSRVYASHFSRSELEELLAFYTSPVGQKALARAPLITAEAEAVGTAWGARVARRAMQRFLAARPRGLES